jgi:hypothetical protein
MSSLHEEAQNTVIDVTSTMCDTITVKVESTRRKCSLFRQAITLLFKLIYYMYVNYDLLLMKLPNLIKDYMIYTHVLYDNALYALKYEIDRRDF